VTLRRQCKRKTICYAEEILIAARGSMKIILSDIHMYLAIMQRSEVPKGYQPRLAKQGDTTSPMQAKNICLAEEILRAARGSM